jgi:arylsulfatase A-like enzyme
MRTSPSRSGMKDTICWKGDGKFKRIASTNLMTYLRKTMLKNQTRRIRRNTFKFLFPLLVAVTYLKPTIMEAQNKNKRPNVVVILTDDMGFSDIGCYGSEIRTPNMDRLASQGVRFTHFYNTARCSPSRASLLTGMYPHQAEMGLLPTENFKEQGYRDDLSKNVVTIAEVFKEAGYSTYMTGKWHLAKSTTNEGDRSNWPLRRGFQRFFGTLNGSGSFYDPGTLMSNNTFIPPGKNFYYTNAISDTAVKFITEHPKGNPFFFYVAFTAAHWPMHAPESEVKKYKGMYDIGWDSLRIRRFRKQKELGVISHQAVLSERPAEIPAWKDVTMKEWQMRRMEVYAAMVSIMDQGVGRIVSALEQKGELDNTVIFYLHDNGGCAEPQGVEAPEVPLTEEQKTLKPYPADSIFMGRRPLYARDGRFIRSGRGVMPGDADTWTAYGIEWANVSNTPYRMYKQWVHEGGIASPLIVQWPAGIPQKGELRMHTSHLIDIMPTCLDIAGVSYPKEYNGNSILPFEGKSLVPAFRNEPVERDYVFWEHVANRAIRTGKWKLVAKVQKQKQFIPADENAWELYDMDSDPSETRNLALTYPDKLKELSQLWEKEALRLKAKPWPWNR